MPVTLADIISDSTRIGALTPAQAATLIAELVQLGRELLSVRQQLVEHAMRTARNN